MELHEIDIASSDDRIKRGIHSRKMQALLCMLLILLLSFALRLHFIREPFERDEGIYGYIGQEILRGAVPFKDAIDIKPPGIYYLYALAMALLGQSVEAVRVFTALYSLGTVILVYLIAARIGGRKAGLIAALLCSVISSSPRLQGSGCNTEVFMSLPVLMAFYLFLKARDLGRSNYLCGSGLFAGLALLVKTVALPQVFLLFVLVILLKTRAGSRLVRAACFLLPMAVLGLLTLAYFAFRGAISEFLYWNITFILSTYRSSNIVTGPHFLDMVEYLSPEFALLIPLSLTTSIAILREKRGFPQVAAVMWALTAFVAVTLPGKYFPHYFIQLVSPLAILSGIGLTRMLSKKGRRRYVVLGVVVVALWPFVQLNYRYFLVYTPNEVSVRKYRISTFVQSVEIAKYLKERTSASDYLYQWGFEPELYFLSCRRSVDPHLASIFIGWDENPRSAVRTLAENIRMRKPKYIVFQPEWANFLGVSEVAEILQHDYAPDVKIGYASLFRRN